MRLRVFEPGNQFGSRIERNCLGPKTQCSTGLHKTIHAPAEVSDAEIDTGHFRLWKYFRQQGCEQDFTQLPAETEFETVRDNADDLLFNGARTLATIINNPSPYCSANCVNIEAIVICVAVIFT